jgi:hypothetical protein
MAGFLFAVLYFLNKGGNIKLVKGQEIFSIFPLTQVVPRNFSFSLASSSVRRGDDVQDKAVSDNFSKTTALKNCTKIQWKSK